MMEALSPTTWTSSGAHIALTVSELTLGGNLRVCEKCELKLGETLEFVSKVNSNWGETLEFVSNVNSNWGKPWSL